MIPPIDRRTLLRTGACRALAGLTLTIPAVHAIAAAPEPRWRRLFDGRTLDGWRFYQQGGGPVDLDRVVRIADGAIHLMGPGLRGDGAAPGHLSTRESFGDYHLRLRYRWGTARYAPRALQRRNSGLLYHVGAATDRLFPPGVEFQIEEGDVGDAIMIDTLALQGPLLGGTPLWPNYLPGLPTDYVSPVRAGGLSRQWHRHSGAYETLDGWNTLDLIVFTDQAAHLVNGRIVNTMFRMVLPGADGLQMPLTRGRLAIEFEQAEISFRDIMIRPLSAADIAAIRRQGSY